jgi:hypothetical protein
MRAHGSVAATLATLALVAACTSKPPPPPPEPAAPPTPPAPPPDCSKNEDCAPMNCCYALSADACVPATKASCSTIVIECTPTTERRFACVCDKGACKGKPDTSTTFAAAGTSTAAPTPTPAPAIPTWVTGGLDEPSVLRVIMSHSADVKACQATAKAAVGAVTMAWSITPQGASTKVTVTMTTAQNGALETCLVKKVGAWRFPARKTASQATYTFKFAR